MYDGLRALSLFAVLGWSVFLCLDAQAGAWMRPVGGTYMQASAFYIAPIEVFGMDDATRPIPEHSQLTLQAYAEHGLLPWLTLVGSLDGYRRFTSGSELNQGPGDTFLGVRVPLTLPIPAAMEVQAILPTGNIVSSSPRIPLGYGVAGAAARVSVGYGFSQGWLTAESGLQLLGGGAPATLIAGVSGGYTPLKRLRLEAAVRTVQPLGPPTIPIPDDQYTNRFDAHYIGYAGTISYRISGAIWMGLGIEKGLGAYQVPWGPNLKSSVSVEF